MRYSVYNYGTKSYDYYDDGKPSPTHAGPPPVAPMGDIGETPEAAAWRVPIGARKVGSGELPQGRIASMGGLPIGGDAVKLGLLAVAAYFAWRHFR
jgi:hypothetical protein